MNKFLIAFLMAFSFWHMQFLQAGEDDYRRYIDIVSYQADGEDIIAQIQLDDGTCWKFVAGAYDQELLHQFQNDIQHGSEVYFEIINNSKFFNMTVRSLKLYLHDDEYLVELRDESIQLLPQIINIEKFSKLKLGDYEERFGYKFTLSDGSIWKLIKFPSSVDSWKIGDRVIITSWLFDEWSLLNIDAPFYESNYKFDHRDNHWFEYVRPS